MTCSGADRRPRGRCALGFLAPVCLILVAALAAVPAAEAKQERKKKAAKPLDPEELFNPLLGVDHCAWLVGPIARIASAEEIERYMSLVADQDAEAFIQSFWAQRNEGTPIFHETPRDRFEARVAVADKRFSEAATAGSKTDRGTIFVVYGEPSSTFYEEPREVGGLAPEVWEYPEDAPPGLDGDPPARRYRFIKLGDHTVFFEEKMRRDPRLRDPFARHRNGNRPSSP